MIRSPEKVSPSRLARRHPAWRRHAWLLGPALLAAAVVAGWGPRRSATAASAPTAQIDPAPAAAARPAGEVPRAEVLGFAIDQSLVIGGRASTPVHASGTLIRTPVRSDPGEDVSAMTFAPGQETGVLATGELQEPFFLVADHRGRPLAVAFAPETSSEARRLAKLIVAQTQVIGPAGAEQRYTTQELDATGVYEADYERTASGWRRTKRAYVRFHGAPQEMKLAGDTQIVLGAGGELRELVTREAIEARGGAGKTVIRGELHVELVRRGTAAADPTALRAHYDRAVREGLAPGGDAAEAHRRKDESITRGAGYAELHGALRAALARPASDERTRDVEAALYGLSALVRLEPEEVDRVAARARAHDASLEETAALSASLGAAGTERATAALEELLASEAGPAVRAQAAVAIAQTEAVTGETVEALRAAARDRSAEVIGAATLALGAIAHRSDPAGTAGGPGPDVVAELLARRASATDPDERALLLEALANSGDPRILPVLDAALADADPEAQAAGAYGLRFVRLAEVDARLAELVARHPLPTVRLAAARAIAFRDLAALRPALEARLGSEQDPDVLAVIERLLARSR